MTALRQAIRIVAKADDQLRQPVDDPSPSVRVKPRPHLARRDSADAGVGPRLDAPTADGHL